MLPDLAAAVVDLCQQVTGPIGAVAKRPRAPGAPHPPRAWGRSRPPPRRWGYKPLMVAGPPAECTCDVREAPRKEAGGAVPKGARPLAGPKGRLCRAAPAG